MVTIGDQIGAIVRDCLRLFRSRLYFAMFCLFCDMIWARFCRNLIRFGFVSRAGNPPSVRLCPSGP